MTDENTHVENDTGNPAQRGQRVELSLVLEFTEEQYVNADGEVNEDLMRREALDYAVEASRGEFDTEISLIDDGMESAVDADQLIERLANGDRDVLSDADAINTPDGHQAVEVAHEAANDERVILHYNFFTAYKSNGEGSMDEIDIFDTENGE